MSNHGNRLKAAYSAWKKSEQAYQAALAAIDSGAVEYNKDEIQSKIDDMITFKSAFDFLDAQFPLAGQDWRPQGRE